jgi:hypothetical protein
MILQVPSASAARLALLFPTAVDESFPLDRTEMGRDVICTSCIARRRTNDGIVQEEPGKCQSIAGAGSAAEPMPPAVYLPLHPCAPLVYSAQNELQKYLHEPNRT